MKRVVLAEIVQLGLVCVTLYHGYSLFERAIPLVVYVGFWAPSEVPATLLHAVYGHPMTDGEMGQFERLARYYSGEKYDALIKNWPCSWEWLLLVALVVASVWLDRFAMRVSLLQLCEDEHQKLMRNLATEVDPNQVLALKNNFNVAMTKLSWLHKSKGLLDLVLRLGHSADELLSAAVWGSGSPSFKVTEDWGKAVDLTSYLIERGADVNLQDDNGDTYLHKALEAKDADMALLLVQFGASFDVRNVHGETPLATSCLVPTRDALPGISLLLESGADSDTCDNAAQTPLHLVCHHHDEDDRAGAKAAKLLLEHGADPEALRDEDSFAPLVCAAATQNIDDENDDDDALQALLDFHADNLPLYDDDVEEADAVQEM